MTPLDPRFLSTPLTHRALHDVTDGRPENSRAAIQAAIQHGFGIEIDLQLSSDGCAMVFHDYMLDRLTPQTGAVHQHTAAQLQNIPLLGGDDDTIPSLKEVLNLIAGRVPLLIEIKDQDGSMGPNIGPLETATATLLSSYDGPVAVMSFNPHSVEKMHALLPDLAVGIVTSAYTKDDWPLLPDATRNRLRTIPDFDQSGASFISHQWNDLTRPRVQALKEDGVAILCWTIRSQTDETTARQFADNVTFEGYLPEKQRQL
ncbi:MAG: glycerophosphodiester phosphodiesterase family protein [Halocynthiibacter sp.]